ncbi:cytidylyltransferase domain-containing protein [Pseudoalteromonas tetraodonis]|uniref:cytidylyltransferase domain-containing protein n=1 Tax=Pseudoalteromonas tetraodonis TaxID=43659 RepID=UPI003A974DD1
MTDTLIILQARMSSSRLPNKVLLPILDKPMLAHQVARLQKVKTAHKLIIATSNEDSDDDIELLCRQLDIDCFRGDLSDVLARYYHAAIKFKSNDNTDNKSTNIVRVTGDCPLIDANVIDDVIELFTKNNCDYCSNCAPATLPDGLDVEIFSFTALEKAYQLAKKPSEREHVTPFIRNNPQLFTLSNYAHNPDLSHYRWTVDEPKDFELVTKIYEYLYAQKPNFTLADILILMQEKPELTKINHHIIRNEGLLKSEKEDQQHLKSIRQNIGQTSQ